MQRRELRPRQELLSLLDYLNDVVGLSARYVFQQQLTPPQLLQTPQSELRRVFPELCGLVDFLLPANRTTDLAPAPPSALVRRVFRHPEAQWLSRSARQSGVSALLCQQLIRQARQSNTNDTVDADNTYWAATELIVHLLLDALLSTCSQRLGRPPDACKWTPSQPKPRFHAMTCFPVWSSLLPFAAMMALRYPQTFQQVLEEHRRSDKRRTRVNCEFAQVTGVWRLVEEMNKGDKENRQAVTDVMISLLRFASDKLLYRSNNAKEDKSMFGAHLDDQLLEKFFTGVQGFAFKSWRANAVLKSALFGALEEVLTPTAGRAMVGIVPLRIAVFMAVGCMIVKDLAADVTSMLVKPLKEAVATSREVRGPVLAFLIGFCAHVELVPIASVLDVLELLVESYKAVLQKDADVEAQQQQRLELIFYVMYVAQHRGQDVDKLRQDVSSDAAAVLKLVSQFQLRLCSEIAFEDFYVAAPVHWTAEVWKHWVFLTDEEVATFVSEAHENDTDTEQEFKERVVRWKALAGALGFRPSLLSQFKQMDILLKPHLIPSTTLAGLTEENGFVSQARKRRRVGHVAKKRVDPDLLERSFDVLHLPDVMERVCSFMSAKRLCRMALVCRAFAELSHRASLWRPLYLQLGLSVGKKQGVLPSAPVECGHGDSYEHNWRQLYQTRWLVLRKLRRMQRRAMQVRESAQQSDTEASGSVRTNMFIPQMCSFCGCNQLLKTASDQAAHKVQHERLTCSDASCRASFTSKTKLRQHMMQHPAETSPPRLVCGFKNCKKTYASAKRMATHRQKLGHT
ncbi:hypothetical protein PRIC1_010943 [Phytophthora ramorum]